MTQTATAQTPAVRRIHRGKPRPLPTNAHLLLRKLAVLQDDGGYSDRAFALHLGVTNGHWSRIRAGTANMGHKTLNAVTRFYPHLAFDVLDYLTSDRR